jgi:hypothetical protein
MATKFTNWFLGKPKERKHMGYGALLHFKRPQAHLKGTVA